MGSLPPPPPADARYVPMSHAALRRRILLREVRAVLALVVALGVYQRWGAPYAVAFLAGFAAVVVGTVVLGRRRMRERPDLIRAVRCYDDGRTDEAIALCEREIDRLRDVPVLHSMALMHLARALSRKGRADEALSMLYALHEEAWLYSDGEHYGLAASIAAAHASLGQLDDAARWQKVAHGRVPATGRHHLAVLDAVMEARRERYAELDARLASEWPALEVELAEKAYPLKVLRLVRAFAMDRARPADGAAPDLGALVDAARTQKGELLQHRTHWPAFDTFLASHGVE